MRNVRRERPGGRHRARHQVRADQQAGLRAGRDRAAAKWATRFKDRYRNEGLIECGGLPAATRFRLLSVVHADAMWRADEALGWNLVTLGNTLTSIAAAIASLMTAGAAAAALLVTGGVSIAIPLLKEIIDLVRDFDLNAEALVDFLDSVLGLFPDLLPDVRTLISDVGLDPAEILPGTRFTTGRRCSGRD